MPDVAVELQDTIGAVECATSCAVALGAGLRAWRFCGKRAVDSSDIEPCRHCPAIRTAGGILVLPAPTLNTTGSACVYLVLACWANSTNACSFPVDRAVHAMTGQTDVTESPPGVGLVLAHRALFASRLAGFGLELTSDAIGTCTDVDKPPRGALDAFFSQEWECC